MTHPTVFLDRDGTLIEDVGYANDPDRVCLLDGAAEAIRRLRAAGYKLAIVSNQSGIGRGLITVAQAQAVHQRVLDELAEHGITIDGARYCPHTPEENCACRKPAPTMLLELAQELDADLSASFMVGDRRSDVEAGHSAGCRSILLGRAFDAAPADFVGTAWPEVVDYVLGATVTS